MPKVKNNSDDESEFFSLLDADFTELHYELQYRAEMQAKMPHTIAFVESYDPNIVEDLSGSIDSTLVEFFLIFAIALILTSCFFFKISPVDDGIPVGHSP